MPFTGGFSSGFSSGFAIASPSNSYNATGTGGVTVGGSAPVAFKRAFAATGSGGVSVSGAAPAAKFRIYTYQPSGGVIVAGSGTPRVRRVVSGTGGVHVGGSAVVSAYIQQTFEQLGVRDYTGTGVVGDRVPGYPVAGEVVERTGAAGTIVPRAEGAMGAKKRKPASTGGGRTVVQHYLYRGRGSITVRGAALVGFLPSGAPKPPNSYAAVGTGGVRASGVAPVSANVAQHYQGFGHGGVTVGGAAGVSFHDEPDPTHRVIFGSGGVRVSGSAPVVSTLVQRWGRVGSGGVRVGGSAGVTSSIRKRFSYSGGGIVIIRGTAPVSRFINAPGGGSGAFVTPLAPATFDTTRNPAHFTSEVNVATLGELQNVIDTAPFGTRARIPLGVDWSGSLYLRNRGFGTNQWIEIAPNLDHSVIEAARPYGRRMNPGIASALNLPTLRTPGGNQSVVYSDFGAAGYRFTGINFRNGGSCTAMVRLGSTDATTAAQIGKRFVVDRCTAISDNTFWTNRAFYLCGEQIAILGTWCADIYGTADTQSILILGWPGPYIVRWNRLEGWTENLMSGGGEIAAGGVPSDITIEENLFTKNLAYRNGAPFANTLKNLIELKSGKRIRIRRNIFEYAWPDGQPFPVIFKSVNQGGQQPQQGTSDVEFSGNWIRDVVAGINLAANPEGLATPMKRVWVHDNLYERVNVPGSQFYGHGVMIQLLGGLSDITLDHNTFVKGTSEGVSSISLDGESAIGPIALRSNIVISDGYAIHHGSGGGSGDAAWRYYVPDPANRIWQQNVAVKIRPDDVGSMPPGTIELATEADVGYVDYAGGDYTIAGALATAGHDGGPVGISDFAAFKAALLNVPNG